VTIEPWHTLLLLEDDTKIMARQVAAAIVGGDAPASHESRRGSQVEEDEVNLMTALIQACDVTKQ
jgi:hypothetical protein